MPVTNVSISDLFSCILIASWKLHDIHNYLLNQSWLLSILHLKILLVFQEYVCLGFFSPDHVVYFYNTISDEYKMSKTFTEFAIQWLQRIYNTSLLIWNTYQYSKIYFILNVFVFLKSHLMLKLAIVRYRIQITDRYI